MNIFEKPTKKIRKFLKVILPLFLLIVICFFFAQSINRVSSETLVKEQQTLEQALRHGAVHTYALTGEYPESLSELLSNYHITYDSEKFIIDYAPNGANLFPFISVLPRTGGKGGPL